MPAPNPAAARPVAHAGNTFGFNLLRTVAGEAAGQNIFLSPSSVFLALAMTWAGAGGATKAALHRTLALPGGGDAVIETGCAALLDTLAQTDKSVTLALANALWVSDKAPLAPAFVRRTQTAFHAGATALDFRDGAGAARTINGWVDRQTRHKIPTLVSAGDVQGASLVLTNAVYFKGLWRNPFVVRDTTPAPFHRATGGTKTVPMMHTTQHVGYLSQGGVQAVRLPYGLQDRGNCRPLRAVCLFARPQRRTERAAFATERRDVGEVAGGLCEQPGGYFAAALQTVVGAGVIPGIEDIRGRDVAFTPRADFAAMGPPQTMISAVIHKAVLEVNEKGSEAAAATGVVMVATAAVPQRPVKIVFDRPFLCAIVDDLTGAVLFVGAVYDPQV